MAAAGKRQTCAHARALACVHHQHALMLACTLALTSVRMLARQQKRARRCARGVHAQTGAHAHMRVGMHPNMRVRVHACASTSKCICLCAQMSTRACVQCVRCVRCVRCMQCMQCGHYRRCGGRPRVVGACLCACVLACARPHKVTRL